MTDPIQRLTDEAAARRAERATKWAAMEVEYALHSTTRQLKASEAAVDELLAQAGTLTEELNRVREQIEELMGLLAEAHKVIAAWDASCRLHKLPKVFEQDSVLAHLDAALGGSGDAGEQPGLNSLPGSPRAALNKGAPE